MIRRLLIAILAAALLFPLTAGASGSVDLFKGDAPVELDADYLTYDKDIETYVAKGNVEIRQSGMTLKTSQAMIDMSTGTATARGAVEIIDEGGNTVKGEEVRVNMREKTVVIARARIFYKKENIHVTGEEIRKTGLETYEGDRVTYTTCDCPEGEDPAWHFYSSSAKITVGEFLTGRNAFFHIKGVPVLYSPYFSVPVLKDRQTGFLQPRTGFSKLRGFVLENAFFWAISGAKDATFYLDLETERGTGAGAEYRYYRTRRSFGESYFYTYNENDIERVRESRGGQSNLARPQSASNDRWRFKLLHTELLSGRTNVRLNLDFVSDDEFFLDFGKTTQEKSLESLESNVSITHGWSNYNLVAQFRLFNNLLSKDEATTLQRLPEVTLTGSDKRIGSTPFYLSLESSFVNFARHVGVKGQRLDIHPRISLPLNPGGWFEFTPSIAPRATFYIADGMPYDKYSERFIYDARAELTTTFIRYFGPEDGSQKSFRHTIRPKLVYAYIPEAVQTDLPQFDSTDNLAPASSITYSINSTLTGKFVENGAKRYFDYMYLDLSQTYDFREASRKLAAPEDERRPFSDITGELRLQPSGLYSLSLKGKYDVHRERFSSYDTLITAADTRGDSLNLAYRFVNDSANYLEGSLRIRVSEPVAFTYFNRTSFEPTSNLESSYAIEYAHQCWTSVLSYTERIEEKIVFLTFNLKGLGKVAGIKGKIEK